MTRISFTLNGEVRQLDCTPGEVLANVLRREGCFSVRFGSDSGETGAAAVLVDGELVSSDIVFACQIDGHEVTTLEGLNVATGFLHPIEAAFVESGALQSGYSAGAMVLAAKALWERHPQPDEAQIRDALSGVLDRETGYAKPVEAVKRAAMSLSGIEQPPLRPVIVARVSDSNDPMDVTDCAEPLAAPRLVPAPDAPATSVVGQPVGKVDGLRLVKGNAAFADDIELRGLLHAKVLHSPHPHARITRIDDSRARAVPGVRAILHCFNTPRVKYSSAGQSWPNPYPWDQVSFDDKVRHIGDRVAAVAAKTLEAAEEACCLIDVTYEVLPAVFDPAKAMLEDAPKIHDEKDSVGIYDAERNVCAHVEGQTVSDAQIEAAFASAEYVFEQTFHVPAVQHAAIEPHIALGWLDEDERLVLRTSTQVPFHIRRMVSPLLGFPIKKVRVIKPRMGGGFGGKQEMLIEDIVGHLVLATRRPVRLELTRQEEFTSARTRHAMSITFRTGLNKASRLVAQDMRVIGNAGAYGVHGFTVHSLTGLRGLSSYNCPAKRYHSDVAYTNSPVGGAMRGYGAPQGLFALECHMDDIARAIHLDPIELRRRNWLASGDPLDIVLRLGERGGVDEVDPAEIPTVTSCGTEECVAQGLRAIGWERRQEQDWRRPPDRPEIRRGIGFALCMQGSGIAKIDMGSASIKINDDGSFNLLTGASDLGTGADTVQAQIAAEVLGVGVDDVIVYSADTDLTPFDVGAYASGTTYISGMAVKKAAEQARERIVTRAARLLGGCQAQVVELHDRRAWAPDGRSITLAEIALNAFHTEDQEQIVGTASHLAHESPAPFGAQFAEVEVDIDTGEVRVLQLVMAVDVGTAINPLTASGQVEGGMLMALGYALTEEIVLDDGGRVVNPRLGPYWIFRADDTPQMRVYLVQTIEPSGPYGAKAAGEIPIDGVAPAVRNAILDATGVGLDTLPMTPERVWRALSHREGRYRLSV